MADSTTSDAAFAGSIGGRSLLGAAAGLGLLEVSVWLVPGLWSLLPVSPTAFRLLLSLVALVAATVAVGEQALPRRAMPAALVLWPPFVYTSLVLPWNQTSYVIAGTALELILGIPVLGAPLTRAVFGGLTLTATTLRTTAAVHYLIVVVALVAVAAAFARSYRRSGGERGAA